MRSLVTLADQKKAKRFSAYLRSQKIENSCEITLNKKTSQIECTLWIREEDELEKAQKLWEEFEKNPEDKKFSAPQFQKPVVSAIKNPKVFLEEEEKKPSFRKWGTYFFLLLCVILFFFQISEEMKLTKKEGQVPFLLFTTVEKLFLFDFPKALEEEKPIYIQDRQQAKAASKSLEKLPYFHGIYPKLLEFFSNKKGETGTGPIFERIRKGEIWRFLTPSFLHGGFLHILFNMIWLFLLGRQIEERIFFFRFFLFVVLTAIISNTSQYLMSGPIFLGFSGVITAMAGFIWMRKRRAPWEGYPLSNTTLLFLAFYVLSLFLFQVAGFFFEALFSSSIQLKIANTGHIVGALSGMVLGRFSLFSWRVS